jgi:peptidyl-tRNA hydrolase, PTH1 family
MLLFVGLGNPGPRYAHNRHNVGFMALDAIVARHGFGPWRKRFQGATADGTLAGEKVIALKPMTYMNESGRSVGEAMRFFGIEPKEVVVFHDELDLAPGKVRVKTGGGVAGHNGLRSLGAHIGPDFQRVRIGIGHPGVKELVQYHVLHDFAKADEEWLPTLMDAIAEHAPLIAESKAASFQNKTHLALNPEPLEREPAGDRR